MNLVVCNYEKLSNEQKALAPSASYILFNEFFEMKRKLALNIRNSEEEPQSDSEN